MIGGMVRAGLADQLPPAQLDRLVELIEDVTARLTMTDMLAVMGDFMAIQAYVQAGNVEAAKYRAIELAERHDAHELAAFLGELARGSTPDRQ